jgi:hypothetical protein
VPLHQGSILWRQRIQDSAWDDAVGSISLGEPPRVTPGDVLELPPDCLPENYCHFEGSLGIQYGAQRDKGPPTNTASGSTALKLDSKLIDIPTFQGKMLPYGLTPDDEIADVLPKISRAQGFVTHVRVWQNDSFEIRPTACFVDRLGVNFRVALVFDSNEKIDGLVIGSVQAFDKVDEMYSRLFR